MSSFAKLIVPAAILGAALMVNSTASFAKPEYGRRTRKECSFCHPANSWQLNDAGKYYRDHKYSLQGYKEPAKK
ncbi:MAG: hypothetical protein LAP40_21230 [Acidobacteriia bacterium]|nr:hypothetical protein [Terriglobia bacterium]